MPFPLLVPIVLGTGIYAGTKLDNVEVFGWKPFDDDPPAPDGSAGQFQTLFGSKPPTLFRLVLYGAVGYGSYRVIKKVTK